jgi:large subunit ribosomal protein L29
MKMSDITGKSEQELRNLERELREQIFNLGFQKTTGQLEKVALISQTKKNLARVLTVIREKELKLRKES